MALTSFFNPTSLAVVGVSENLEKLGSVIFKNIIEADFKGDLYGVNPKLDGQMLLDIPCVGSIAQAPKPFDMVVIVVPGKYAEGVVDECVENGTKNIIIISAGFGEVGQTELEQRVAKKCTDNGINLLGPNCLGAIIPSANLNASFADGFPRKGKICFASQSGAFCTAMLDWAAQKNIGFSHLISLGNKAGISEIDILESLADDPEVEIFAFYLESLAQGTKFLELIKRVAPHKPVIILEPGRSVKAAAASSSHTGSLAPNYAILEMAYKQAGAIQAFSMRSMFGLLEILTHAKDKNFGRNIAVLTNAGGVGVMATDAIEEDNLNLTELTPETMKALTEVLPAEANTHNPVDIIGDAKADRYEAALKVLVEDDQVDQILVLLTPQRTTEVKRTAEVICEMAKKSPKNIVASFVGGARSGEGIPVFEEHGVPHFEFPIDATRVLSLLSNRKELLAGTSPITHLNFEPDDKIETWLKEAKANHWPSLPQDQVNYILEKYGFDFPQNCGFTAYDKALECAESMFPGSVVMKISAPDALHKTDVQGVILNVNTVDKFKGAWKALSQSIEIAGFKDAHIQVQEQIPQGTEIIMGLTRDENFGPVMLFGTGGIYTEVYKDTTVRVLPTHDFADMVNETKIGQILHGVRGEKPKAVEPLIEVMHKLQRLVLDYPAIASIDINPVMVTKTRAVCVDFKILT